MTRLSYSELALSDIEEILDYISRDKPSAAIDFVESILDQCEALATHPELGIKQEHLARSLRMLVHRGYRIYYRWEHDEVKIERVLHPGRSIGAAAFE
ncbi:MAG: type II toxin-antitoxin system RelE/ParE family toxin [Pirellulales bacterium]